MRIHNPNCDGDHCHFEKGAVRVYPLGAGGNLILCRSCWTHENGYRYDRGVETGEPENWPQVMWDSSEIYNIGN
jgi:hypothetical protein